ncbi:hypothetical protein BGX26_003215 [Mortierella sp. AD094]|nr:hypothetical protein BGX26_003215 [Mortierella sp. AD094]
MAIDKVKLFCILDGDSTAFKVIISLDDDVDDLKKAIKEEKPNDLKDFDADRLVLWRVDIPIGDDNANEDDNQNEEEDDDKPILLEHHLADAKKIRAKQAATEIHKIFGTAPPKNTIHIIVERLTTVPGNT